jgi:phenylalanyl-tRNA synthetase beta subunit
MRKLLVTASYLISSKEKSLEMEISLLQNYGEIEEELAEEILRHEKPDDRTYQIIESSPRGSKPPQRITARNYLKQLGITVSITQVFLSLKPNGQTHAKPHSHTPLA